jgi:prepilin-type N-terminal cleavage/methylation domain-containing protein
MNKQKGFTLVEAAIAIGVVAILSGIIIPLVLKNIRDSQVARAKNDLQVLAGALAAQMKDTGRRPNVAGGPNACTGAGDARWSSGGSDPIVRAVGGAEAALNLPVAVNTFQNLLSTPATDPNANALFGYPGGAAAPQTDFGYRGPYLAADMAGKSDPWGNKYVILGYSQDGQTSDGPIWIVCAGPGGKIAEANVTLGANGYPRAWDYAGVSAGNIVLRIH